ncbi:MAG: hypothetical protein JO111_12515 [Caulobacteraceae bacterium]|nr:hypothetical protein [Caulobacteraceae bacterium]
MAEYKLYIIDEDDWISGVKTFHCEDDELAVIAALDSGVAQRMELWSRDRLVERFGPAPCEDEDCDPPAACGENRPRRRRAWGAIRTPALSPPPPSWSRRNS